MCRYNVLQNNLNLTLSNTLMSNVEVEVEINPHDATSDIPIKKKRGRKPKPKPENEEPQVPKNAEENQKVEKLLKIH